MATISTSTNSTATFFSSQTHLCFASDGTAFALWPDGSGNLKFSTASSPYTSWAAATTISASLSSGSPYASAWIDTDATNKDNIEVAFKDTNPYPRQVTLTKSGTTWTVGTVNTIAANNAESGATAMQVIRDGSTALNLWVFTVHWTSGTGDAWDVWYSTNNGSTWTSSLSGYAAGTGGNLLVAVTGKWLLMVRPDGGTTYWRRLDTTGTLTSWSTEQSFGSSAWGNHNASMAVDGNGKVFYVTAPNISGTDYTMKTYVYTPSTDTWSSATTIGSVSQDNCPSLVNVNGDLYCIYSQYSAANNYAIVYKVWHYATGTWDSSATTIQISGSNRVGSSAAATSGTLGSIDTLGTASPYTIEFLSAALAVAPLPRSGLIVGQAVNRAATY